MFCNVTTDESRPIRENTAYKKKKNEFHLIRENTFISHFEFLPIRETCFSRGRSVPNLISLEEKHSSIYSCLEDNFIRGNVAKHKFR